MRKSDKEVRRSKQFSSSKEREKILSGTFHSSRYSFEDDTHNI